MKFNKRGAELFIPDDLDEEAALKRTTVMAISAHEDDVEMMAVDGILKCFQKKHEWFSGIAVSDGAGSLLGDIYQDCYNNEIIEVRKKEQKKAAYLGEYGSQFMLNYTSAEIKDTLNRELIEELKCIFLSTKPKVIYTHNLFDKHETHVATVIKVLSSLREIRNEYIPDKCYGCEVWGTLDWLVMEDKVIFDVSGHFNIAQAAIGVFDSQIAGGKQYQEAVIARHRANATFNVRDQKDSYTFSENAIDMTGLIKEDIDLRVAASEKIESFKKETINRLSRLI